MGKTQCNSNGEKQVLHATKNGKVEKKECESCPLLTRATYILESQVEKITWKAFLLSEQKRQQDEYVKYLEERLQDSEKTATDIIVATMSSYRKEGETICLRESVACQTELVPVNEEVYVEIPNQTQPSMTKIEKGSNEDENEMATACDRVEYSENIPLTVKKTRNGCLCFWCLKTVIVSRYSRHTRYCKVRLSTRNTCCECGGLRVWWTESDTQ